MNGEMDMAAATADFPDWLSPMLVKELRQGMRSRVFVFSFLVVQVAMIFIALIGLIAASAGGVSDSGVTFFYWLVVVVPLVLIMPSSGFGSITREKTANTLEPIFLTRLTARRILLGKWAAIAVQTLLLVFAILPYAVLRYYLGGVNLVMELTSLGWLTAGSVLLSAVAVGASPMLGRLGRLVIPIAVFFVVYVAAMIISEMMSPILRGGGSPFDWRMDVIVLLEGFLLGLMMLESGAGKIAPAAENHSTSRRLVGLAAGLTAIGCSYLPGAPWVLWLPSLVTAGLTMIAAVCEPVCEVPSVYRPFVRRGALGRALGRLFYPGWPAGVLFSLALAAVVGFRVHQLALAPAAATASYGAHYRVVSGSYSYASHSVSAGIYRAAAPSAPAFAIRIMEAALFGALFLPMALYRLLPIRKTPAGIFFFGFQIVCSLMALVGVMTTEYGKSPGLEHCLACIPTCALWYQGRIRAWNDEWAQGTVLAVLFVIDLCSIAILLARMRPEWRAIRALEKTAGSLAPTAAPIATPTDVPGPSEAA